MTAPPASPRRRAMRDLVVINQRWRRRSTGQVVRIVNVHRADRLVEVMGDDTSVWPSVWPVSFTELRKRYELLLSPEAYR